MAASAPAPRRGAGPRRGRAAALRRCALAALAAALLAVPPPLGVRACGWAAGPRGTRSPPRPAVARGPRGSRGWGPERPQRSGARAPTEGGLSRGALAAEEWLAGGFYRANVFVTLLLATEIVSAVRSPQILEQTRLGMVPVLLTTSAVLRVLRNATLRNRLGGTTFRVLALANVAAFSAIFYHISFQLWRLLFGLPGPLRSLPLYPVFIALLAQCAAFYSVRASYRVLEEEGLPSLGRPRLKNILAFGYALTMVHQVVWGGGLLLYSNVKTTGALRCFVLAACAYVCQTAAVAGPRRLSSDTYKTLNVVLCIDSALRLAAALRAESVSLGTAATVALPAVALASSAGGWLLGKLAKK